MKPFAPCVTATAIVLFSLAAPAAARTDDATVAFATLLGRVDRILGGAAINFLTYRYPAQSAVGVSGLIVTPSPEPCVFEVTEATQLPLPGRPPMITQYRYDLRRLAAVEYLRTPPIPREGGPHVEVVPSDSPDVSRVRLRGPGLVCSRGFDLSEEQPRFRSECEDAMETGGLDDTEGRRRIDGVLARVLATCPVR